MTENMMKFGILFQVFLSIMVYGVADQRYVFQLDEPVTLNELY